MILSPEIAQIPFQMMSAMRSFTFPLDFVIEEAGKRVAEMAKVQSGYDMVVAENLAKHNLKPEPKVLAKIDRIQPYEQITAELREVIKMRRRSVALGVAIDGLKDFVRYATHTKALGVGRIVAAGEPSEITLSVAECRAWLETFTKEAFEAQLHERDDDGPMGLSTVAYAGHRAATPSMAGYLSPAAPPELGLAALSGDE